MSQLIVDAHRISMRFFNEILEVDEWLLFLVGSCTSADITAFFKGMQVVADGIFLCTHADGRPTGEVSWF